MSKVIVELDQILKTKHFERKDLRAFAYEVVAQVNQRVHYFEESLALTVTPLASQLPKPSAWVPSACAESPPECALVMNGKEAMRPSNTVPTSATGAVVQQIIGVSVKTGKKACWRQV